MRKILLYLFVVSFCSAFSYGQSVRELEAELKSLQDQYLDFKASSILKRDEIDKNMKLIDDQINQLYNSKNIAQQELFVLKDSKETLDAKVVQAKEELQSFNERVSDLLNKEKMKTKSLLPYLIEPSILKLKAIDEKAKSDTAGSALAYLEYRKFLFDEASVISIRDAQILNPRNELTKVKELRLGFVHDSYVSDDGNQVGFLINKMTLSGPLFFWRDASGSLATKLKNFIFEVYNNKEQKVFDVPFDIGGAGDKLPYFLNIDGSSQGGLWEAVKKFFDDGGVPIYPLVFAGILGVVLIIERSIFFWKNRIKSSEASLYAIVNVASSGDVEKAKLLCKEESNLLTRVLERMLEEKTRKGAEEAADEILTKEVPRLEKHLSTISMIAAISPLMGLLGTVVGMITLFNVITLYGSNNPKILAGGISIALITTQTGLMIALPLIVFQHILTRVKTGIVIRVETLVLRTLNKVYPE